MNVTKPVLLAALAFGLVVTQARAEPIADGNGTHGFYTYSSIDVTEGAYFATTDLWAALNGDWSKPGFLVKAFIGSGQYDYHDSSVVGRQIDVVPLYADLMFGYYGSLGGAAYWNVLIGVGVINNDLDPNDPTNPVRGSETGFKVSGDLERDDERPLYYHLEGEYTTAYDTYWSRARIGPGFGQGSLILGPEGTFFGDETYDAQRVGGFVRFPVSIFRNWRPVAIFAGGYEFVHLKDAGPSGQGFGGIGGSGDGAYGTASLEFTF